MIPIVVETLLEELFSQIPDITYTDINKGVTTIPVKYDWGGQDDLNLYMKQTDGNRTPLIWLVQAKGKQHSQELIRRTKLIIAKSSENKTAMNPKVWRDEFRTVLDPLLEKVIRCLQMSGVTMIMNQDYDVYREANYSEYLIDPATGKKTQTKTIDHWNVIEFEADIKFMQVTSCIQTINFN